MARQQEMTHNYLRLIFFRDHTQPERIEILIRCGDLDETFIGYEMTQATTMQLFERAVRRKGIAAVAAALAEIGDN